MSWAALSLISNQGLAHLGPLINRPLFSAVTAAAIDDGAMAER